MDYKALSERICALRKDRGWTQKQLADMLSVTDKTVSKWETGYTVPDVEMLDKLAKVFDCTLDELVNGSQQGASTAPVEQSVFASKGNRLSRGALIGVVIACILVCLVVLFVCLGVFVWAKRPLAVQGLGGAVSSVQVEEETHLVRATAPSESFSFSDMQLSSDKATVTVYSDAAMTTAISPDVHLFAGDNVFYVRIADGDRTVAYTVILARDVDFTTHMHVAGEWAVLCDSNCVETGTRQTVCTDCGKTYTEVIPAKDHTEVVDAAVAATCTATGLTEGKHCSVCGTVLVAQTEVAMIDHQYVNGVCTQCGAKSEAASISIGGVPDVIVESISAVIESNATIRAALGLIDDQDFYFNGGKGLVNEVGAECSANMYIAQLSNSNVAELTGSGDVKANLIYISVNTSAGASAAEITAAKKAASEYVYTAFVQINSGKFEDDVVILLPAGTELDASAHEWKPVKHFSGYFGTTDAEHPIVIDGAKLTSGTGYLDTLYFDGDGGKYFITGFFGTVYGDAVIENVTFRNLTMDQPGSNYDMSLTTLQHSRNSIGVVGGVIDTPSAATNVTLRNIVVEDNCTIKGAATAAGLVGYVGASSKEGRLFNGTLTIENCHVSATVIGGPEAQLYGPCGGLIGFVRRTQETGDMDGDGKSTECYNIVIKDCTFDGSVTGYQSVGAVVGDVGSACVIVFDGANDFSDVALTSVDPNGLALCGIIGTTVEDIVVYTIGEDVSTPDGLRLFGDKDWDSLDRDARGASAKFDTLTDTLGNPIGGNNGVIGMAVDDGTGDGSVYNLRVWCAEEDVDMIWEMLTAYKKKYKDNTYQFTVEKQGEDTVASKALQDPSAAADVFSFANDQLGNLIYCDALTTISDAYTAQIDNQIEVARMAAQYNGLYYAIPYSYENCFLYYNKSLVSAAQVASMDTLLNASIAGVTFNLGIDMADSYYTTMFLYTAGVEIFGEQGVDPTSVDLANDYAIKACRYIASLQSKKKLGSIAKADQYAALKNGRVAAMISGPHMISQFKEALGANFGVAMLPTIRFAEDSKDSQLVSFSGVKMYGVSRKSTNVRSQKTTEEALNLAAYLANVTNQQKRLNNRAYCPTDCDLFEAAVESGISTVEVEVAQSEYSKLKPGLKQMSNYWENMAVFLLGVYKLSYKESDWLVELKKIEDKLKE